MGTIIIGVTGSIACFKAVELVKELKNGFKRGFNNKEWNNKELNNKELNNKEFNRGFDIEVILTKNAEKLIDKGEFEKVLGKKAHTEMFYKEWRYKDYLQREEMEHISLAEMAELFVICPATANIIGKIANGIGDDLLTTSVMATNAPVLICPAMNHRMWENKIVQKNVCRLKGAGYYFVEPEKGRLACGSSGIGRLAKADKIKDSIMSLLAKKKALKNKKIIVTAGATSEEIDPVRVITNKSSGRMGVYIAEEAAKLGAEVTLIRGRTEVEPAGRIRDIRINSAKDMLDEIRRNVKKNDVIIHAAAVGDFSISRRFNKKISSGKSNQLILRFKKNKKIIEEIKRINRGINLVGFKAEHDVSKKELLHSAYSLLKRANAELIVANDTREVFGSEYNDVYIVGKNRKMRHIKGHKREIARAILGMINLMIDFND